MEANPLQDITALPTVPGDSRLPQIGHREMFSTFPQLLAKGARMVVL
jgi:hypothetical protein